MVSYELFGPVDAILGASLTGEIVVVEVILLGLVVANMAARGIAHRRHVAQAEDGPEAISRHPAHLATNVLMMVAAFYYLTLHHHAGLVASVLVIGIVLTDVFEFESRKVEARREIEVERPKAAILASVLALVYVGYVTFLSGPLGGLVGPASTLAFLF
jgi:membrane protein CcdC involved in cytochrome C biogenesis